MNADDLCKRLRTYFEPDDHDEDHAAIRHLMAEAADHIDGSRAPDDIELASRAWSADLDRLLAEVMKLSPVPASVFEVRESLRLSLRRILDEQAYFARKRERERLARETAAVFR